MAGYLLDTSVVSALAPGKPAVQPEVADWLRARSAALFLPSIAVAEIAQGIAKLRRAGGEARAAALAAWLARLVELYGPNILAFDSGAALVAGEMADAAVGRGCHPGFADVAIAATALVHGLTVLTCNLKHFEGLGVAVGDPFGVGFVEG